MESGTLRERKKARTREVLVETAFRLFCARGFDATTIDEIAARAEVGRRTFFRYFPSKEAVVYCRRQERLERFRAALAAGPPVERRLDRARRGLLALAADYMRDRREVLRQQRVVDASPALIAYERRVDEEWEGVLAAALAAPDPPDRTARIQAAALMGVARTVLREWFAGDGRDDLVEMGRQALDLLGHGLFADSRPNRPVRTQEKRR